jgi:hypothetical protein
MRAFILLFLAAAIRAHEWLVAHPHDNSGYTEAVDRLGAAIDRIRTLGQQVEAGSLERERAVARAGALMREIRAFLLRPVALIASVIFKDAPERAGVFRMPYRTTRKRELFLSRARAIRDELEAARDRFVRHGMDPALLTELDQALDELARLPTHVSTGRRTAIDAHDSLELALAEVRSVLKLLDGLNRHRFRAQPDLLASWASASDIPWPKSNRKRTATAAPAPSTAQGTT